MPSWWSWLGLLEHVVIGAVITLFNAALHQPIWVALIATGIIGVFHEMADGDFTVSPGHPWNGLIDVLAFMAVPLMVML